MTHKAIVLAAAAAASLAAQPAQTGNGAVKLRSFSWETTAVAGAPPQEATIGFVAAEEAVKMRGGMKGAPYSATIENGFLQVLADGTRIERKSQSKTARDSEGRTRTETVAAAVGAAVVEMPAMVFIHDPVAKRTIILNEKEKTATVMPLPDMAAMRAKAASLPRQPRPETGGPAEPGHDVVVARTVEVRTVRDGATGEVVTGNLAPALPRVPMGGPLPGGMGPGGMAPGGIMGMPAVTVFRSGGDQNDRVETLGQQTIEGVRCEASRRTHTIPPGQIGNDRPIEIVTETCLSPELKTMVSSRTVDPMHGETTMRLSGVSRAEPAASLFEVPAGYTVREGPGPMMLERRRELR
ncbi:MAG: hypothetical protein IT164_05520 [Bryobacterales bacterium]|nr:hypothetical protein [Bryobacterales bacterium]